ncbi:MAG: hypothetical protein AB7I24_15920 [Candidatus Nanopelagicales bacterium]
MAIEYRTGDDGTVRAGLVGGPDVREIVAAVEDGTVEPHRPPHARSRQEPEGHP